jgi:hypothetical protein
VRLAPDADISDVDLSIWSPASFIIESYKQWWREWKEQLFATSAHTYRHMIDPEYAIPDDAVSFFNSYFFLFHISAANLSCDRSMTQYHP